MRAKRKALLAAMANELEPQLTGAVTAQADRLADLARAETLRLMGHHNQAADLLARWWSEAQPVGRRPG